MLVVKNWKFRGGGGALREIPSVVGVWIFSGTTHSELVLNSVAHYSCLGKKKAIKRWVFKSSVSIGVYANTGKQRPLPLFYPGRVHTCTLILLSLQ